MNSKLILTFLNFKFNKKIFFLLHCILLARKIKFVQGTIGGNLIVLLKNGKKVYHCGRVRSNSDFMILDA